MVKRTAAKDTRSLHYLPATPNCSSNHSGGPVNRNRGASCSMTAQRARSIRGKKNEDKGEAERAVIPPITRRSLDAVARVISRGAPPPQPPRWWCRWRPAADVTPLSERPMSRCGGSSPRPPPYRRTHPAPACRRDGTYSRPPSPVCSYPLPPQAGAAQERHHPMPGCGFRN